MSNANYTPIGTNRKVFGGGAQSGQQPIPLQQTKFVDAMGRPIERQVSSGACSKCGFQGHLPYQCRNNLPIEIDGSLRKPINVSSSDESSDFETPLQREDRKEREREAKRLKKQMKKLKKKESKKRKRSHSSDESSGDERKKRKKHKKDKKERKSKSKKSRRHSSSSSS